MSDYDTVATLTTEALGIARKLKDLEAIETSDLEREADNAIMNLGLDASHQTDIVNTLQSELDEQISSEDTELRTKLTEIETELDS